MTFVYQSQYMHSLLEQARRFAGTSATVLLLGESGTGKELMERYLHSHRSSQPCVTVKGASVQENLIESELFGYENGAFMGAVRQREGCIPPALDLLPLRDIERHVILSRLRRFEGTKTEAAAVFGVTARTLYNKMAEYQQLRRAS